MSYMEKKYKLTDETIEVNGKTLYRIEALKDFSNVKKGDKGGFIEKEENLSHLGNAWVYDNAKVLDCAQIYDNAKIANNATVCITAKVFDNAMVYNNAIIEDAAQIYGYTIISGEPHIKDKVKIYGDSLVYNKASVYDEAIICNSKICDNVLICDNAIIENTKISGNAVISHDAKILSNKDYIVFKNWWSSGRYFTWTRSNNMWSVGCFYGTGKELIEKAYKDSELSGDEYKRIVEYVNSINNE